MGVLLRLLVVLLCSASCWGQLPSQDILALLDFKKGIRNDPTGFVLGSWNDEAIDFNGCPSSWNGIMCNGGNVAAVVLDNLQLGAEIDLGVLSNLSFLVKLSLANNSISGKLPTNLAAFRRLEYLDISDNLFSSELPAEIGELVSLKNLSLAGNNFTGLIPDSISQLKSLQSLDLSRNLLSGSIPLSLTKLEGLVYLNLSQNGLTKSIPKGLEEMNQLDVLDLHGNMLDGELDLKLLLLANASYVDLSGNSLVCSMNKEEQKILNVISPSIRHLNLSHNRIEGSLVGGDEARVFGSLNVLDLSHNQLTGELPGFNFAYDIQVLRLGSNSFSGFIPSNLLKGDSLVLKELDLSSNNLTGSVGMITSTTLHTLNLSSNMLSGELPLLTGSCVVVDFSRNQFEGSLMRILKWGDIQVLDLSQNRLTGPIPEVTAQFLRLNYLNLSANLLNGTLPTVLTEYRKLANLDLSFNQLGGRLLPSFLASSTLNQLHLQNNMLFQEIDLSLVSNNSVLRVIDLSNNRFTGDIPNNIGSLPQLQVLKLAGNNFSGSIPTSIDNISTLTVLDLSRNSLTGALPMNLSGSLQSFNVSFNSLSGVVPENLREFPRSSFHPGNSDLELPNPIHGSSGHSLSGNHHLRSIIIVMIVVACVSALLLLILLAVILIRCNCTSRSTRPLANTKDISRQTSPIPSSFEGRDSSAGMMVSSHGLETSRKGAATEVASEGKMSAITGFSPPKASQLSWSPESGDSYTMEGFSKLDVRSPEQLAGELYFLDDTISFTAEELSKAPAEVLGRSSHGTSYRATLENGMFLTVKWLRDGVAKQKKEFAKEAKKFANIRHPNVVGLRGYYWGPTQHEKLILSDYVSPGSLASFLYDKPGRKGPTLTWLQRLKIAVDIARGLNYLHFDRAIPHGNLKATNILLEGPDLNAKVADYCLHRLMTQSGTTEQILDAGVLGYRAPELAPTRKPVPTFKSDVYAFGVILLELLTGKCAGDVVSGVDGGVELTDWVRLRVAKGQGSECLDAALAPDMDAPLAEKGMKEVLGVALTCIRPLSQRPAIKNVYEDLSSI